MTEEEKDECKRLCRGCANGFPVVYYGDGSGTAGYFHRRKKQTSGTQIEIVGSCEARHIYKRYQDEFVNAI